MRSTLSRLNAKKLTESNILAMRRSQGMCGGAGRSRNKLVYSVGREEQAAAATPQGLFRQRGVPSHNHGLVWRTRVQPSEFAVLKIHEALAQMNDDYLRSAIDYFEVPGVELDSRAQGAAFYKFPNLGVVSWARFRFYETDFGWAGVVPFVLALIGFRRKGIPFCFLPRPPTAACCLRSCCLRRKCSFSTSYFMTFELVEYCYLFHYSCML